MRLGWFWALQQPCVQKSFIWRERGRGEREGWGGKAGRGDGGQPRIGGL